MNRIGIQISDIELISRVQMVIISILGKDIQSMIGIIPFYIPFVFILVTGLSIWFFYKAANSSRLVLFILCGWALLQGLVAYSGFYTVADSFPPRFLLLMLPPFFCILFLFLIPAGQEFVDQLDLKSLTLLQSVRLPVELVLYWLFLYKQIPELMTFEGRNYDVLTGLSAPLILYYGFSGFEVKQKLLLFWNLICLGLLLNIIINALLSAPFPFQQFGFEQPNVAVLYFPFIWLPCLIAPLALLAHLAALWQLSSGLIGPELEAL